MELEFGNVNYWAILVAAIVKMVLGAFWYSPKLFGELWAKALDFKEDVRPKIWHYGAMFIIALVIAWVLSLFVHWTHLQNVAQGAGMGFFIWLGFIATTHLSSVVWNKVPLKVYVINVTYLLFSLVIMSIILTVWQ